MSDEDQEIEVPTNADAAQGNDQDVAIDGQSAEDGIAELKQRLEAEKQARLVAEQRAYEYHAQAQRSGMEVQDTNLQLINGAIDKLKRENDYMKQGLRQAMSNGNFDDAADIQEAMSINAAKLLQLENGRVSLEARLSAPQQQPQPQSMDPVEQVAATLSPRSAAWVRSHPECITNQKMYYQMVGSHNLALSKGYAPDSDDYFDFIERELGFRNPQKRPDPVESEPIMSAAAAPAPKRNAPPAAPTTRNAGSSNAGGSTVRLTAEMREMAQMMGMTPEEYAKNMVDLRKEGKIQ